VSYLLSRSVHRPTLRLASIAGLCTLALVLQASPAGAAPLNDGPLAPYIINGQEASISQFPWQVFVMHIFVEGENIFEGTCGGSILDSTHILTAAHCVDHEGTTTTHPAEDFFVLAGASDVSGFEATLEVPAGSQERRVARVRADPYYSPLPNIKDDVSVLELSRPLELSAAANAEAIPLVATGDTPAPGTALSLSGYGKQNGSEGAQPNGRLYSTTLTAVGSDACRNLVGVNSAVLLCAISASSSGCEGDSGGPLTEGNPPVEVGVVDFGGATCPIGAINGFTNVAAPEVRAFIEGSESPPVAARQTSPPRLTSAAASPVDFSPLTCEPGGWSGSPSFTYTFQTENAAARVLQSGPSNVYAPPASLVGIPLVCIVQASNPGGVSTGRTGTTPPIGVDSAAPVASIARLRCRMRTCTLSVAATDPNAAALGVEPWVSYEVSRRCAANARSSRHRSARQPVCHRTASVIMPVSSVSAGLYQATATGLPYDEAVVFTVVAANAAGLRATPVFRTARLSPPSRKRARRPRSRKSRR